VLLSGASPLTALSGIAMGAFGERYTFAETLVSAIPLALIGLSVAPALRAGVFTIGSEGQMAIGAMIATASIMGFRGQPAAVILTCGAVGGVVGGVLWALLPALLRAYGKVNEILSTLLLNYIAGFLLLWSLRTWLATPEVVPLAQSEALPDAALIPKLLEGTRLHWGIVIVPIAALALAWWLRSARGVAYRVIATHPGLAARMGLSTPRAVITTMLISGGVAGLAGWLQVTGVAGTLYPTVAGGLGFAGVLVALLGRLNPIGILVAALFFGALENGADGLQAGTGVPSSIAIVIVGLVLLVAALAFADQARKARTVRTPAAETAGTREGLEGVRT
jgi:simple sugar transport system permease protein